MSGLTESQKKQVADTGAGASAIEEASRNVDKITRHLPRKEKEDDSWKDSMLMQPTEAWDKTDKKGRWGDKVLSMPSRKYRERYDLIDWTK